ncbi:MAG: Rieske 2Fe-2S domain-containing protein [Kiritimatiellae bacterium]|nr:Rieske 2Fe-2S domain-containing protein [Kiritimatiellia bacterium]MDD5522185.1 Rieske 2Fe-2S domain-containing protein [Kiritimatiellia bacterium]
MSGINRRKFIAGVVAAGSGTCVCGLSGCATFTKIGSTSSIPSGAYVVENNKMRIDLAKVPELGKIGGSVKIIDPKLPQPIIIGRSGDAEYAAVSIKCPHRGVEVEYKYADKQFRCASIGHSTFATDGTYRKGLAKKSLSKFDAKLDQSDRNTLIISL